MESFLPRFFPKKRAVGDRKDYKMFVKYKSGVSFGGGESLLQFEQIIEFDKMLSKMQYNLDAEIKRGGLSVQQKQVLLLEKKELQRIQEWNQDYLLRNREFKLKKYDNFKSDIKTGLNFIKFW